MRYPLLSVFLGSFVLAQIGCNSHAKREEELRSRISYILEQYHNAAPPQKYIRYVSFPYVNCEGTYTRTDDGAVFFHQHFYNLSGLQRFDSLGLIQTEDTLVQGRKCTAWRLTEMGAQCTVSRWWGRKPTHSFMYAKVAVDSILAIDSLVEYDSTTSKVAIEWESLEELGGRIVRNPTKFEDMTVIKERVYFRPVYTVSYSSVAPWYNGKLPDTLAMLIERKEGVYRTTSASVHSFVDSLVSPRYGLGLSKEEFEWHVGTNP